VTRNSLQQNDSDGSYQYHNNIQASTFANTQQEMQSGIAQSHSDA